MLIYNYWPDIAGGAEKQCRLQAHELARRGHSCLIVAARTSGALPAQEMDNGCEVVRVPVLEAILDSVLRRHQQVGSPTMEIRKVAEMWKPSALSRMAATVVRWINTGLFMIGAASTLWRRRQSLDLIHVHIAGWHAGFAGWIGHFLGIPVICKAAFLPAFPHIGGDVPLAPLWRRWRQRISYIALTSAMAEDIVREGVSADRVCIIPNGVDIPDQAAPVDRNQFVLYVGNFTQRVSHKAFDVLIRAWARVVEALPEAHLVVAGAGDSSTWQVLAETCHCRNSIEFAGHVSDMPALYHRAALFVLPSRGEGISNALLEAQAHGVPAVVSDIPGNCEVVVDGTTGLVVPVDDPAGFAQAILDLLGDPVRRSRMGKAARERIRHNFSVPIIVDRICSQYENMLHKVTA
ncbi:MAG: glycosyltransferase family 4 protein [Kiritimatiellae bacterium]|nr:glycosyltransferase family 4 protein [Kiritimatiellia bacterium]MDD5522682.1 glycosyltransferase family 4 protein [Kiritimatiellia bacterium]